MLPLEIIEAIVLQVIFSNDPRAWRRPTINSLSLLSRDWSLQTRRLEFVRIELESIWELHQLLYHLVAERCDSSPRRTPARWLAVDLGESQDPKQLNLISVLLDLLDLSHLQVLKIKTSFSGRYNDSGFHLLLQPSLNGHPILPRLRSLTAVHLSGQSISNLILACDTTRLETLHLNTIGQWMVEEDLRLAGVTTFPKLTSLAANFYGGCCGCSGFGTQMVPNLERLALTSTMRSYEWREFAERLEQSPPRRLASLEVLIAKGDLNSQGASRAVAIYLARQMGWAVSITMMDRFKPVELYDFTAVSEISPCCAFP